jgi:hypothetical protein
LGGTLGLFQLIGIENSALKQEAAQIGWTTQSNATLAHACCLASSKTICALLSE